MSCSIKQGDRIQQFPNGQYFVDGIGFMSLDNLVKCEFAQGYRLELSAPNASEPSSQSSTTGTGLAKRVNQETIIDPTGLSPNDAIQMGGGNMWLTILLLLFSFFGGGKLSKFLEIRDSNNTRLDELSESIKESRLEAKDFKRDTEQKHEEIDKNLDRLAAAIKLIQEQAEGIERNNQRLLQKYEILLGDDIPDLDEITIRLQKIEKQHRDMLMGEGINPKKTVKTLVIADEKKLNEATDDQKPKKAASRRGTKNNANSV